MNGILGPWSPERYDEEGPPDDHSSPSPKPGEPTLPPLHWYCWIHDTPEECEKGACDLGYWLCPEDDCRAGMESDDEKPSAYRGVWRCTDCETSIDFATLRPA